MGLKEQVVIRDQPGVLFVGVNRPEKRNALSLSLVEQLQSVLKSHRETPAILVLHSCVSNIFVSGADIAELKDRRAEDAMKAINIGLCDAIAAWRWPVIAAIDGIAFGGGLEVALAADLRIATTQSRFAQPELSLGIIAGAGAHARLIDTAGLTAARELLYLGRVWGAQEAFDHGLIDEIVEDDVLQRAEALAREIAEHPFRALELTKLALSLNFGSTSAFDRVAQALLFESSEKEIRMERFLSRKKERG